MEKHKVTLASTQVVPILNALRNSQSKSKNLLIKEKHLSVRSMKENQRVRLEKIGKKLGVKDMSDWGKITTNQVKSHDPSLLSRYNNSLRKGLLNLFPGMIKLNFVSLLEVQWRDEWFVNGQVERGQWDKSENVRNFLEEIAKQLGIKKPSDWGKVSISQFIRLNGGTLIRKFHGSLLRLLKFTYPGYFNSKTQLNELRNSMEYFLVSQTSKIILD